MLCNIVISLKLSDEGLTNKPKAHKQPFNCGKNIPDVISHNYNCDVDRNLLLLLCLSVPSTACLILGIKIKSNWNLAGKPTTTISNYVRTDNVL